MHTKTGIRITALLLAVVLIAADQVTKAWAISALDGEPPRRLIGDFLQLQLIYNPGAAFSLGESATWIVTIIAAMLCVALFVLIMRASSASRALIFATVFAGGIGNLIDRLTRAPGFGTGHVIDFINYNGWFIGNVADVVLVIGIAALIISELRQSRTQTAEAGQ
ncbi:MAG: signal peptidase II [Actinomycetaceae bacterium]|nr:signal peptidase II [Arcanobacterium sp.]MDD7505430.1 signal peptidase II [Actinomycetaceae bacterium]